MSPSASNSPKRRVVLSVEQALSMPYATERFVQLGWRVIRIESTKARDPNRSIGRPVAGDDRHSYFVAPNVGKEAMAIDLKSPEGRALLLRLIRTLGVDVFCTNTLPAHHRGLGIDDATLRSARTDLIWCGISAMGREHPDVPGYDPVMQALCGYMDLTGPADGPPLQCGPPIIDLKAGDEAFAQVLLALMERAETGQGKTIDVSMAQAAVSWLVTFLPMLELGSPASEIRRSGNEHRQFIPTNAYRTRDGFVYLAIGSDLQWSRLVAQPMFASLADAKYATNEGRRADKVALHAAMTAITSSHATKDVDATLTAASIPHAPITPIDAVLELPFLANRLLQTITPDGRAVRLPPPAVETGRDRTLPFAPSYGEHTSAVLSEIGLSNEEIATLRRSHVIA